MVFRGFKGPEAGGRPPSPGWTVLRFLGFLRPDASTDRTDLNVDSVLDSYAPPSFRSTLSEIVMMFGAFQKDLDR